MQCLQDPALYTHPVQRIEIIETHISWLILTGPFAYKAKKPIDLGFVDFSDALRRRHFCHEELRLNRRLAPALYVDVWAISGGGDNHVLLPDSDPNQSPPVGAFDYLVRMKQFAQDGLLDHKQEQGELQPGYMDELARNIAAFHLQQRGDTHSDCGSPESVISWATQNFDQSESMVSDPVTENTFEQLRCWTLDSFSNLYRRISERKASGFVRDCHGDLHLGNIALINGAVTVFDCIEFNRELRVIDVISEVAFLYMDLLSRNEEALGWRFLDQYLAVTGDYAGLDLLRFYTVYRAMVRAKVELIQIHQAEHGNLANSRLTKHCQSHLSLAQQMTLVRQPRLILTRGLSGSGKSTLAAKLVEACGLIRLRSDIERKRLFAVPALSSDPAPVGKGIYSLHAGKRTYQHLVNSARSILAAGYPVIIDATFLKQEQRLPFQQLAERCKVPFHILDMVADTSLLRQRIHRRLDTGLDPSEADSQVLDRQIAIQEPLVESEMPYRIPVSGNDGGIDAALPGLVRQLGQGNGSGPLVP